MRRLGLLCLCVLMQAGFAEDKRATEKRLVVQDKAYFRVDNKIYFVSDVVKILDEIGIFRCIFPHSKLIQGVKLNLKQSKSLKLSSGKAGQLMGDKLLTFLKVVEFSDDQKVVMKNNILELMNQAAQQNHCLARGQKLSHFQAQIMRAEIYFRTRFKDQNFWVSKQDIPKVRQRYPGKSDKEIISLEKQRKKTEAVYSFLESIKLEIKHRML